MKRTEKGFPCRLLLRERRNTALPLLPAPPHKLLKETESIGGIYVDPNKGPEITCIADRLGGR
jgi:hypothetical protein